jgi:hypothetical protein
MLDGMLGPAAEVPTGTPHVSSKVFATAHYPAMLHMSPHASTGSANLSAAFLHLPFTGIDILLSDHIQRGTR